MPRVGGLELLTWLRTHDFGKALPVIVMTESSYDKDITSAYRLSACTFFTKPFAPADFIAALKYTTDNWLHGTPLPAHPSLLHRKTRTILERRRLHFSGAEMLG